MTLNGVMAFIMRYFTDFPVRCCRKTILRPTSISKTTFTLNTLWPY